MKQVLIIAKYLCDCYKAFTGEIIDELKLQKLIYFAQRESLAITNKPLFKENLEGWVHGPVSVDVRSHYVDGTILGIKKDSLSLEIKQLLNGIVEEYGSCPSWKLRELSHQELSWKNSRTGLKEDEHGSAILKLEDIRIDARKVRPFDHVWGMYYDEFETVEHDNHD